MKRAVLAALCVLVAACGSSSEAAPLPSSTVAVAPSPSTAALDAAAAEVCQTHAWSGLRADARLTEYLPTAEVSADVLASAIRRTCPDVVYEPLSRAETDWCGDGMSFGRNYFKVIAAGVDLGIESFAVVEAGLVSKAANGVELSDYEVELLTAALQTMSESTRFERDWAAACRTTF